jgi:hypothetical protein
MRTIRFPEYPTATRLVAQLDLLKPKASPATAAPRLVPSVAVRSAPAPAAIHVVCRNPISRGLRWTQLGLGRLMNNIAIPGQIRSTIIDDQPTGDHIEISVGIAFTRISINGRDHFFGRLSGRYAKSSTIGQMPPAHRTRAM